MVRNLLPLLLLLTSPWRVDAVDKLCSLPPATYTGAKNEYSDIAFALNQLEEFGIATWYSDRLVNGDARQTITDLVNTCDESTRLSVVVYGLPNKDCAAGYSNGNGTVVTSNDYVDFVTQLAETVGERKVLYVLEPDAVGLIADDGCAVESGYKDNLLLAIPILARNPNAEIYLDVGFWTLASADSRTKVAQIVNELSRAGRLKGITLNTSNYRSTQEIATLCTDFQQTIANTTMHCIIDTSRNFPVVAGVNSSEWCNKRSAGVGIPPSNTTGYDNLDYFVWIKPPGDSDGTCDEADRTNDSMKGPEAGVFFKNHFIKLWNQGHFVQELKMAKLKDPDDSSTAPAPLQAALFATATILATSVWLWL
uniref:Glycoside hydrolase family 6 protein n=1 Tax=Globisporangium ultimum (strain ATCC 200006 / CBS 805.95 / DAOM BR144) TaxID=431595 RepID=K3WJB4_GLOUD